MRLLQGIIMRRGLYWQEASQRRWSTGGIWLLQATRYVLPRNYRKILLSKDRWEERDGIEFVPYYQFIFENSVGRELFDSSLNNK